MEMLKITVDDRGSVEIDWSDDEGETWSPIREREIDWSMVASRADRLGMAWFFARQTAREQDWILARQDPVHDEGMFMSAGLRHAVDSFVFRCAA